MAAGVSLAVSERLAVAGLITLVDLTGGTRSGPALLGGSDAIARDDPPGAKNIAGPDGCTKVGVTSLRCTGTGFVVVGTEPSCRCTGT